MYEETTCHDCKSPIIFDGGIPAGAQVTICWKCEEKRRKALALQPTYEPFSKTSAPPMEIDGKTVAVSRMRAF
jgi:hypothetical protein